MTHTNTLETAICLEQELTIDAGLMTDLESISEKRETIATLLEKTNEHAENIKPSIYQRVAHDYETRLGKVLAELEPLAHTIGKKLCVIAGLEVQIRERLVLVEDQIEEQTFRCLVGEFDEDTRNHKVANLDSIKAHLEEQIHTLEHTYSSCNTHIGGEWRSRLNELECQEAAAPAELTDVTADDAVVETPVELEEALSQSVSEDSVPTESVDTNIAVQHDSTEDMSELALIHQPATAEQAVARAELQACLQLFNTKGEVETFEMGDQGLSIGKSSTNDIVLRRAGVSRKHATLTSLDAGRFHVVDHSGRGIGINGDIKEEGVIGCGDIITIAKVDLELMPAS